MNHTEYVRLRIGVCEDTRLQASTHQPEDMGMQGCKRGHMNLRIWGCKDARIQASKYTQTYGYKDERMRGCKQVKHIKYGGYF